MNSEFNPQIQVEQPQPSQIINEQQPVQPTYVTYVPYGLTPETYEDRKSVKKIANVIGGSLLIMTALSTTIVLTLRLLLSFIGMWGQNEVDLFEYPAFMQYLQVILSILMFTVPFMFLYKVSGFRISSLVKFKKPKKKDILPYFLLGAGVCPFANFSVSIAGSIFESFGFNYEVSQTESPDGILGFMLTFIAIAVVPPLVEEFACRGLILGSLQKFGDGFAIVCSAILFGTMHGNFRQIPFAFLVGLVLGFITVKTKTIWISVAVHAFNNAVSVIIEYCMKCFNSEIVNVFAVIILSIFMLFSVLGVWLLSKNEKAFTLKKPKIKSKQGQVAKWFFTAPTIIIFIVISILESMLFFVE
jgi:membrane protease YdiL (CAAX protease family)